MTKAARWTILPAILFSGIAMAQIPSSSSAGVRHRDTAGSGPRSERVLRDAVASWMTAMRTRDAATLDMMMAQEFTLAGIEASERPAVPRAVWIDNALNHLRLDRVVVERPRFEIRGAEAIVRATITWAGRYDGEAFQESVPVIDEWRREGDRWRVVSRRVGEPLMR